MEAVAPEVGPGLVALVNTREEIGSLLKLDDVIDLVRAPVHPVFIIPPASALILAPLGAC